MLNPKRHFLGPNFVVEAVLHPSRLIHLVCGTIQAEKVWQGTVTHRAYISLNCVACPSQPIPITFGTFCDLADIINCAKFQLDQLSGFGMADA
jgi:hypothetical protein